MELNFIKLVLPDHYSCKDISGKGTSIYCESLQGGIDDSEHWELIVTSIHKKFGSRFSEIWHKTKFRHLRFIVYFN